MTLIRCGAVAGTCLAAAVAFGVTEWPLERLQLAAGYFDGPAVRTEQNVREMREAGIDLLIHSRNGDTNTFALLEKYGIRTVLNDLCDNIVMGPDKVGRQHELYPPAWYARQAKRFVDAPAIVGIDAGDEPSALDFPYLGEVIGQVSELFPGKYPYFNIYPNYASLSGLSGSVVKSQLGTATYEEHVAAYLKHMPLNYICFDHYLYPRKPEDETAMVNRYHDNFRVVSDACRASGRQLCFWAQVSTPPWKIEFGYTRTNQMRYQAFTALAYGARMICWGCYAGGWWTNRVLTATGEKTVLYDRLKTVNHEVRRLQSAYDRLRWLGTTRVRGRSLDAGCFRDVGTEDGAELVVGEFTGRSPDDPARGLLVVAGNDPLDLGRSDVTVRLKCETAVRVFGPEGEMSVDPDASGVLRLRMKPNACALFVTRRTADEDGEDVVRFDLSGRKADDGLFEDLATVSSNCVRTGRRLLCQPNVSGDLSVVEKAVLALGGDFERTEGEKTLVTMLRDFRPTASSFVPSFSNGYFLDLKTEDGTRLVVGDRVAKDEFARRRALVVFAAGDGSGTGRMTHRITFRVRGQISVFGSQGSFACPAEANGLRSLRLADGELAVILLQNGKADVAGAAEQANRAWRRLMTRFYVPKTQGFLDFTTGEGEAGLMGKLPTAEEIAARNPCVTGWCTGMENGMLNAGPFVLAALRRWELTHDREAREDGRKVFWGMVRHGEASGVKGFVIRTISPLDGKSFYPNSSRDQYTLYVYTMWKALRSDAFGEPEKATARRILGEIAQYAEKCVTKENDYRLLDADGKPAWCCQMWMEKPGEVTYVRTGKSYFGGIDAHEIMRLPMFYAAAWDATGDAHWREMELKYADSGVQMALEGALPESEGGFAIFQAQISHRLLYETEPDAARKAHFLSLLKRFGGYAQAEAKRSVERFRKHKEGLYADWPDWRTLPFCPCWENGLPKPYWKAPFSGIFDQREIAECKLNALLVPGGTPSALARELFDEMLRDVDFDRVTYADFLAHVLMAYWYDFSSNKGLEIGG